MSICKISKFVFWQKYVIQKDENSTIELPVKFYIETMLFVAKITAWKFSPFFTGISQIHVLNFKLTLTWHLTYFKKKLSTHMNLLVTSFRLPPSVYFYGPSFLSYYELFELLWDIYEPPDGYGCGWWQAAARRSRVGDRPCTAMCVR